MSGARALDVADYAALFGLRPRHSLAPRRHDRTRHGDTVHETRWLDEHDADGRLVARYRTWVKRSATPPGRNQFGWERWSLEGEMLDREVRYSSAASIAALH